MRRPAVLVLVLMFAIDIATPLAAAAQQPGTGAIQGTAQSASGQTLPNYTVQLRNIQTGQLAGSTTSNAAGSFSFTVSPANYVIEIVNPAGAIVGTSSAVTVTAGATVTVTVSASAAAIAAAGAAAGVATTTAGAAAGISTLTAVLTSATIASIVGVTVAVTQGESTPSQ